MDGTLFLTFFGCQAAREWLVEKDGGGRGRVWWGEGKAMSGGLW